MTESEQRTPLAEQLASVQELHSQLLAERAAIAAERAGVAQRIASLEQERDNLRASHERLRQELELLKRRILIAKAERIEDPDQLELEFAEKMRRLDELAGTLGLLPAKPASDKRPAADGKRRGERTNNRGTGRRDLRELDLVEDRIKISDPHLERLVEEGKLKRHGFDETYRD